MHVGMVSVWRIFHWPRRTTGHHLPEALPHGLTLPPVFWLRILGLCFSGYKDIKVSR